MIKEIGAVEKPPLIRGRAMTQDEAPHFMKPNEDCMGNPTRPYWRQFLKCSDGNYIIGTGQTEEECEVAAALRRQEREVELNLAPEIRLRTRPGYEGSHPAFDQGFL